MYGMTPEERFTRIENLLTTLTDRQVLHEAEIEKLNAGIRDLVVVSRTLVDAQKETNAQIQAVTSDIDQLRGSIDQLRGSIDDLRGAHSELREAQKTTEEKLHILIETVERIIRQKN
jgi:chromosome segregation ATPase